jgi:hypothetical protein
MAMLTTFIFLGPTSLEQENIGNVAKQARHHRCSTFPDASATSASVDSPDGICLWWIESSLTEPGQY